MEQRLQLGLLITILICHDISGERCRFASTTAIQGSCIFPCHCTNGCDTTTGACVNGGQCADGQPSGHNCKWTGPACQEGNIAYHKSARQSIGDWGGKFPAGLAVDGDINPSMSHNHCAHPDTDWGKNAWWMVDLGDRHNVSRVIIYNIDKGTAAIPGDPPTGHQRLDTFKLSFGDRTDSLTDCARHNHRVASGGTVESQCRGIGRYVRFSRDGGFESYAAGLCEVVVIGHRHIVCSLCPSSSTCNDVIGCDVCSPGKQQPDCMKECEGRTYGTNCLEVCGHCQNNGPCSVGNGTCNHGCEMWYTSHVCKTYINTPSFEASVKPDVDDIGNSSVTVRWPSANNITSGLESYYYYIVWLKAEGNMYEYVTRQRHTSNTQQFETNISKLQLNTNYSIKVVPYRQQNERFEAGLGTATTTFKTSCIAPDTPTIENVTMSNHNECNKGNIHIAWKTLSYSGCDRITAVAIYYKRHGVGIWLHVTVKPVTGTKATLSNLTYDVYDVRISAMNNEKIISMSRILTANLLTELRCSHPPNVLHASRETSGMGYMDTTTYTCESGYSSDGRHNTLVCSRNARWEGDTFGCTIATRSSQRSSGGLGTGLWIGIAVGTFVLGIMVATTTLLIGVRMRSNISSLKYEGQQRDQPPIEMDADNCNYDQLTRPPGEPDVPNVYDVISA